MGKLNTVVQCKRNGELQILVSVNWAKGSYTINTGRKIVVHKSKNIPKPLLEKYILLDWQIEHESNSEGIDMDGFDNSEG
jgi:hypothetical protein